MEIYNYFSRLEISTRNVCSKAIILLTFLFYTLTFYVITNPDYNIVDLKYRYFSS